MHAGPQEFLQWMQLLRDEDKFMFVVVDASVWVSRLVSEDALHERVKAWMSTCLDEGDEFLALFIIGRDWWSD